MEPTTDEMEEQLVKALEQNAKGGSRWFGMTYEQGVENALRWVMGETESKPMEDE